MPHYKLRYFDMPGAAEPIRLILSYGQIPFEDDRIAREDWPKIKPTTPLGQVPVLEIDGEAIPQKIPICRYLATVVNLDGKTARENLAIDVGIETLTDLQKIAREAKAPGDESKKQEREEKLKNTLSLFLGKLDEQAKKNGGYIALPRLTWLDIFFVNSYESLKNVLGLDVFAPYPNLEKVKSNVLAQPGIKEWIKKRPDRGQNNAYNLKQDI